MGTGSIPESNTANLHREVTVTDIQMPFWSMVRFMVKWAIASIPAFLILIVLTVASWTAVVAFVASLVSAFQNRASSVPTTQTIPSSAGDQPTGRSPDEETAYLDRIQVKNVSVGKSVLGDEGVFGEVKNLGDRTVEMVEITIYCLGKDGKIVFEKTYRAVTKYDTKGQLKPGYSRQFGVKLDDAPSDWAKKVTVKVSEVAFPADLSGRKE
jgi:hypothetical protein